MWLGGAVLHEVSGHPVVLAAGEALDGFAEVAAQQRGSAFARRADEHHGEALIEGHGDERGLAVARDAFDANMFCVDGRIGLEIVECAAGAPGPRAQCAPVFGLARLAFVDEADDAAREAGAVVGLHAGWVEQREAPAGGDQLPRVGQVAIFIHLRELKRCGFDRLPRGMLRRRPPSAMDPAG